MALAEGRELWQEKSGRAQLRMLEEEDCEWREEDDKESNGRRCIKNNS